MSVCGRRRNRKKERKKNRSDAGVYIFVNSFVRNENQRFIFFRHFAVENQQHKVFRIEYFGGSPFALASCDLTLTRYQSHISHYANETNIWISAPVEKKEKKERAARISL